ncbi:MAG: hypothetical protein JXB46_05885, partial [Candidatus Eisenbacteria bacterium]|nr:hypothetical protein [Candidatus Eisenbacteria bacterium]
MNTRRAERTARSIVLLLVLSMLVTSSALGAAATVQLTADGQPKAVLVLPDAPHPDEELAAREIAEHVHRISGATLPIVKGAERAEGLPVRIGLALFPEAAAKIKAKGDDPAAFLLSVAPGQVRLAGLSPEGTL